MARVNVEHKALTDQRFEMLGKLLGSNRHEALGRMLLVWHECQEHGSYILPEKRVNIIMGTVQGSEFLIESDLAERVDGGLRIKGTVGRIEWLQEKRETGKEFGHLGAKHGKKGGRPKKGVETGSRGFSKPGEGVLETGSPGFQNPPPPPPPPLKTEDPTGGAASPPPATTVSHPKTRKVADGSQAEFIREFTNAWFARYGEKYPFAGGKDGSAIKWIRGQLGDELSRFREVVARYFADSEPFVVNARHNLGLLMGQFVRWTVSLPNAPPARKGGFKTHDDRWGEMMFGDGGTQPGEAA